MGKCKTVEVYDEELKALYASWDEKRRKHEKKTKKVLLGEIHLFKCRMAIPYTVLIDVKYDLGKEFDAAVEKEDWEEIGAIAQRLDSVTGAIEVIDEMREI